MGYVCFNKMMLGLHLVLLTLHGWLTMIFEQDKEELVTPNTTFSVVAKHM